MASSEVAPPLAGNLIGSDDSNFVIAEWEDPGGAHEKPFLIAPFHIHHNDDEAWYVLEGVLRFYSGGREIEARAGSAVLVPRGTAHTYWNPGPDPARYLLVMTPTIKRLIDSIHAATDRSESAMKALFQEHDSEYIGWSL